MLEFRTPGMAAAAVLGLHGWFVGNRDLVVKLGDREILDPRYRSRGCPPAGRDIWETQD